MGHFRDFTEFLSSDKVRGLVKVLVSLFLLIVLLWIVDSVGFNRWSEQRRLTEIVTINQILQDTTLTQQEREVLLNARHAAITRKNISLEFSDYLATIFHRETDPNVMQAQMVPNIRKTVLPPPDVDDIIDIPGNPAEGTELETDSLPTGEHPHDEILIRQSFPENEFRPARNNIWFFISSNWSLIVLFIVIPFIIKDEKESKGTYITTLIVCWIVIGLLFFLFYWLFGLIFRWPIFGHWWLTYTLIALIPIIIGILIAVFSKDDSKDEQAKPTQ